MVHDSITVSLPDSAIKILQAIPQTNLENTESFKIIPLKGATTDKTFQIVWHKSGDANKVVVLKVFLDIYCIFVNRKVEMETFDYMSKQFGYGPKLLGRFEHGKVEEFVRARTLSASELCDLKIMPQLALKLRAFHSMNFHKEKSIFIWDRMRFWYAHARHFCTPAQATLFRLDDLKDEIYLLEKELPGDSEYIGFCHNNLKYDNIMMDLDTKSITLISYEYAGYCHVAFDIANLFCEMAANYHTETPHFLDFEKYPDLEERQKFIHLYLSSSGDQPSDLKVNQMVEAVEKYTLASHLIWGLWGMVSNIVNDIHYNYLEYATQRFDQYWSRKTKLLGSPIAHSPLPRGKVHTYPCSLMWSTHFFPRQQINEQKDQPDRISSEEVVDPTKKSKEKKFPK